MRMTPSFNIRKGSLYEKNKVLNAISVVEKIYDDFDFEHFKQTLLENDVEIKDDIYNIPFKRNADFYLKLRFSKFSLIYPFKVSFNSSE